MQLNMDDNNIDEQFSEIILCIPTIYIEREKYREALGIIEMGIKICEENKKNDPLNKLYLMRASIHIVQQEDQKLIDKEILDIENKFKTISDKAV